MIELNSITYDKVIYFDHAQLEIKPGITVVQGLNKNCGNVENSTNGVGKSLLIGGLPNVVYASSPMSSKRNDKKGLFVHKGAISSVELSMKYNGVPWIIKQYSKGASVNYTIKKSKTDQKFPTATKAEEFIRSKLFPLSESLFYSTVYCSIQRFPTFQRGTDTQRLEFFTEIFQLDQFDILRKECLRLLKDLRDKNIKSETLAEQLAQYEQDLIALHWTEDSEQTLVDLQEALNNWNAKYIDNSNKLLELGSQLVVVKQIAHFEQLLSGDTSTPEELKSKIKKLKTSVDKIKEYSQYLKDLKNYEHNARLHKEAILEEESELAQLEEPKPISSLDSKIKDLSQKVKDLKRQVHEIQYLRREFDKLEATVVGDKPTESEKELTQIIFEQEQIVRLSKHVKGELTKCPLCQSKFDASELSKNVSMASKKISRAENKLAELLKHSELDLIVKKAKKLKGCEDALQLAEKKLKKYLDTQDLLSKRAQILKLIKRSKQGLAELFKPEPLDEPKSMDSESLVKKIKNLEKIYTYRKELSSIKREASKEYSELSSKKELDSSIHKLEKSQSKVTTAISEINKKLPTLISDQHRNRSLTEQISSLRSRVSKYEKQLKDVPVLEALVKAYGSKGLKVERAQQIATMVSANLNKYSSLIFAESFRFRVEVEENKFSVLVDRGNSMPVTDVRTLSGAESSCFNLLTLISILPLIPSTRRVDTLFLDEMDAPFGEPIRKLFVERFLPILNQIVPKLVVVATRPLAVVDARQLVVIKDGKQSTLHEIPNEYKIAAKVKKPKEKV